MDGQFPARCHWEGQERVRPAAEILLSVFDPVGQRTGQHGRREDGLAGSDPEDQLGVGPTLPSPARPTSRAVLRLSREMRPVSETRAWGLGMG